MINLLPYFKTPDLYAPSPSSFWNDKHISEYLLKLHLDTSNDSASRPPEFIEKSVDWICSLLNTPNPQVLDLGCGPGLYTYRLANKGCQVTGVDISERSINYAINDAKNRGLQINYICQDYMKLDYQNQFNIILLTYCDYSTLTLNDKKCLFSKINDILTQDGIIILDVFTPSKFPQNAAFQSHWETFENGGFWSKEPHICFQSSLWYNSNIALEQTIVATENDIKTYYQWMTCYTVESLTKEISQTPFIIKKYYSNITGLQYTENSDTICVILEKR